MESKDQAIDRARKLLALANNNTNAEEAALAAQRAQEVISKHGLDAAMLSLDDTMVETVQDEPIFDYGEQGDPLDAGEGARRVDWKAKLSNFVAYANSCEVYYVGPMIHVVGRPTDVSAVRYLYAYLVREIERLLAPQMGWRPTQKWQASFCQGCVDTIMVALAVAERNVRQQARLVAATVPQTERGAATALMKVNAAIAILDRKREDTRSFVEQKYPKMKKAKPSLADPHEKAREMGREAAKDIKLTKPSKQLGGGNDGG